MKAKFCLITLIVTLSASCYALPEELEYAYPDISVWTTQRDQDGKLKNPLLKLADELFSKAGIPWHPQDYPAKRMFANLRAGVSKFSMLVNSESLLQGCCLVSKDPVALVEIRSFYRGDSEPVHSIEQLKGKSVITIQGYGYAGFLKHIKNPAHQIVNYPARNHTSAFAMLSRGRAEYVIDYAFPAAEILEQSPIPDLTYSSLKKTHVYLVLHKDYPDAEKVMQRLEEVAQTLDKGKYLASPVLKQVD